MWAPRRRAPTKGLQKKSRLHAQIHTQKNLKVFATNIRHTRASWPNIEFAASIVWMAAGRAAWEPPGRVACYNSVVQSDLLVASADMKPVLCSICPQNNVLDALANLGFFIRSNESLGEDDNKAGEDHPIERWQLEHCCGATTKEAPWHKDHRYPIFWTHHLWMQFHLTLHPIGNSTPSMSASASIGLRFFVLSVAALDAPTRNLPTSYCIIAWSKFSSKCRAPHPCPACDQASENSSRAGLPWPRIGQQVAGTHHKDL